MKKTLVLTSFFTIISATLLLAEGGKNPKNPSVTAAELKGHIQYLAGDELQGRFTGSEGAVKASEYIKEEFTDNGFPAFFKTGYFQEFPFISGVEMTGANEITLTISAAEKKLKVNEEFVTIPFSDKASVSSDLVFAGYGISAPDLNYDDYQGIDVKGKTVILLKFNPDIDNPHSKFDKYNDLRFKAKTALDKGASAIIFVNGYLPKDDDDKLAKMKYDGAPAVKSLAAVQIKRNLLDEIFKAEGIDLEKYQKQINETKKPASFVIKNSKASITSEIRKIERNGRNVACIVEGSDPVLKNEYIVVGAHYDHLGYGEVGSLYKGTDVKIHYGADDNASGTSGVLEVAEKFASMKNSLKRSVIFVAFAGEEEGLIGSNYFVQNLDIPVKSIKAMINMDMIGRLTDTTNLIINGAGTSSIWKDLLTKINSSYNFKLSLMDDGYGGSDQSSFVNKDIPALFFFTGIHNDYHRPSDTPDKINYELQAK
ncbi:MAG: M20/M25/M40 family metallo-hydrolase, partial [Syntrophothermus sp.]